MKRTSARSSCTVAAAAMFIAVFGPNAFADKKPTKEIDFTAVTPKASALFAPTGVVVKIVGAGIDKNGIITARATIVDSAGQPLDRLGVYTAGPVSMSFIAATIPAGQTQYVSSQVSG